MEKEFKLHANVVVSMSLINQGPKESNIRTESLDKEVIIPFNLCCRDTSIAVDSRIELTPGRDKEIGSDIISNYSPHPLRVLKSGTILPNYLMDQYILLDSDSNYSNLYSLSMEVFSNMIKLQNWLTGSSAFMDLFIEKYKQEYFLKFKSIVYFALKEHLKKPDNSLTKVEYYYSKGEHENYNNHKFDSIIVNVPRKEASIAVTIKIDTGTISKDVISKKLEPITFKHTYGIRNREIVTRKLHSSYYPELDLTFKTFNKEGLLNVFECKSTMCSLAETFDVAFGLKQVQLIAYCEVTNSYRKIKSKKILHIPIIGFDNKTEVYDLGSLESKPKYKNVILKGNYIDIESSLFVNEISMKKANTKYNINGEYEYKPTALLEQLTKFNVSNSLTSFIVDYFNNFVKEETGIELPNYDKEDFLYKVGFDKISKHLPKLVNDAMIMSAMDAYTSNVHIGNILQCNSIDSILTLQDMKTKVEIRFMPRIVTRSLFR